MAGRYDHPNHLVRREYFAGAITAGTSDARVALFAPFQKMTLHSVQAVVETAGTATNTYIIQNGTNSIGTLAVVEDSRGQVEMEGIQVHVISTGEFKGAFVDGAPITDGHLAFLQERIDNLNGHFLAAISKARDMPMKQVREVSDGRVWLAAEAKAKGLIDGVGSVDAAREGLLRLVKSRPSRTRASVKIALAELG